MAMTTFTRKLGRVLATTVLVGAGVVTGNFLTGPAPAQAFNGPCWDQIKDNPTPVRAAPRRDAPILKWKYPGQQVTGPCWLFEDNSKPYQPLLWYQVNYIYGPGGYAYIWAPHLRYFYANGQCYPYKCGYTQQ